MVLGGHVLFSFLLSFVRLVHIMINDFLLLDKCRSDPTENDSVEGLRPNARGPGLVTFGVCLCDDSVAIGSSYAF
jgi:hypothetical protein